MKLTKKGPLGKTFGDLDLVQTCSNFRNRNKVKVHDYNIALSRLKSRALHKGRKFCQCLIATR